MSTTPRPWRLHIEAGCATIFDAKDNVVGPIGDLELGWTDSETGIYHDPEDDVPPLKLIVYAVNTLDEAKAALEEVVRALSHIQDMDPADRLKYVLVSAYKEAYAKAKAVLAKLKGGTE